MAYGPIERGPVSVADVRTPVSAVGSGVRSARMDRTGRGDSGRGRGLQSGPPECNASLPVASSAPVRRASCATKTLSVPLSAARRLCSDGKAYGPR